MRILVLGATSGIGQSILNQFSKDNELILVGRSLNKLKSITSKNNPNISLVEYDLSNQISLITNKIKDLKIDLLIHGSSSSSSLMDSDLNAITLMKNIDIELINTFDLIEWLINKNKDLQIIFISTILTKLHTSNRSAYTSFKLIQELYLKNINGYVLIVTVATQINKFIESKKSKILAKNIKSAFEEKKQAMFYGSSGKILLIINKISPIFLNVIIFIKRKIQKLNFLI